MCLQLGHVICPQPGVILAVTMKQLFRLRGEALADIRATNFNAC
jgi:hypothetical protein